jgi:DNA replication licensing factor MCM6
VREAYSLLRQSIIHVEQDDIDFDEEELEGEREGAARPRASETDDIDEDEQDIEMSAAEIDAMDQMEGSSLPVAEQQQPPAPGSESDPANASVGDQPPPPPKRRMIITHDKYMTLQSLIVFHIASVERETGAGVDRDDLIDWYLEEKEPEMQDSSDADYEKELIIKMIRKLVKVCFVGFRFQIRFFFDMENRTTICSRSRGMCRTLCLPWTREIASPLRGRM